MSPESGARGPSGAPDDGRAGGARSAVAVSAAILGGLLVLAAWDASVDARTAPPEAQPPRELRAMVECRLDLNRAAATELSALPGLGPRLAQRIVQDRAERGPFTSVEDIQRVAGIGPAKLEALRRHVVVHP